MNIYGIASSMSYLHKLGILHRDLKPDNILVDDFLLPKLADFGLSKDQFCKDEECQKENRTELTGTIAYISPEKFEKLEYTKAGEVYAFALVVYKIMTSQVPFVGRNENQVIINVTSNIRHKFNVYIPQCYKELIEDCWQQDPNKRPSFEEIVYRLKNNPDFITDLVEEEKYFDYIEMIDISENQNISTGQGFINIEEFIKDKCQCKSQYWKYFKVSKKDSKNVYSAKMSTILIPNFREDEKQNLIKEVETSSHLNTINEILHEIVHKNGRPNFPPNNEIPIFYREIIESCWSQDPYERPSFEDIVYRLKNDQRLFNGCVRKEEFNKYVKYVDGNKEVNNKEEQKIEETDSSMYKINEINEELMKKKTFK